MNAFVDVYLPRQYMWTEGRIVAQPAAATWIVQTDAWIDDANNRTQQILITDPHHLWPRGRFCRFNWRMFLRTAQAGVYVDACCGSDAHFGMAKVLRYHAPTDTILVRRTEDGQQVWLPLTSPRLRFVWEWD